MWRLIETIVKNAFEKYGSKTLFQEYEFQHITVDKTTAFYRMQSAINYPYMYEIQMRVFDEIVYKPRFNLVHKCKFCNEKFADYKFKCCSQYTHFGCAVKNNLACCYLGQYLSEEKQNVGALDDIEKWNDCCVCLEKTNKSTACGHPLCLECLINMYKNISQRKILCPYCREVVVQREIITDYTDVKVNDSNEVVLVNYL